MRIRAAFILAAASALLMSACQSLDQLAPPVAMLPAHSSDELSLGRELYVTKCTKCHAPEPVLKYSAAEWEKIVPDMAKDTKLSTRETAAVRDYIMAVLNNSASSAASSAAF